MTSKETTQNLVTCSSSDDTDNSSSTQIDLPDAIDEDEAEPPVVSKSADADADADAADQGVSLPPLVVKDRNESFVESERRFAERRFAGQKSRRHQKREERSPSTNSNRDIAAYSGPSTKTSARNKRLKRNLNSFVGSLKEMYEDEVERVKEEHENEKAALKAELQSKTEEIEALKDEVREQATKITELEATFLSMEMILVA